MAGRVLIDTVAMGRVALLLAEMDEAYSQLVARLDGLTDEEFFWQPVHDCWTIYQDQSGRWTYHYAIPEPQPAPMTTISVLVGSILDLCDYEDEHDDEDEPFGLKSHRFLPEILQGLHQVHREPRRNPSVDHAVIVRNRQRQHQALLDLFVLHHRLHPPAAKTKDGHLRGIYDRREVPAADSALV